MRDRRDSFPNTDIVVVTFANPRTLHGYRQRFADPLAVVADTERVLYQSLGFGHASTARVWSPQVLARYARLMIGGHRIAAMEEPGADLQQLGGNAIIDRTGRLAWRYRGSGPDDRPSLDLLRNAAVGADTVGGHDDPQP